MSLSKEMVAILVDRNIPWRIKLNLHTEVGVAQSVSGRPSELEGRQFDPPHSIDLCFDFPLFRIVVA